MYVSGSMSQEQFDALINDKGYPKLADYLKSAHPDGNVAAVGEKNYAVYSMGGPGSDNRVTFGGRSFDCDDDGPTATPNTWRGPAGVVPTYISEPSGPTWAMPARTTSSTSMPTAPSTTAPSTPPRPGCTRCRATATSAATTRTTRAVTSG